MLWRNVWVAFALVACEAPATEPAAERSPPPAWEVAPPPGAWPLGRLTGSIGRGVAPQPVAARTVVGRAGQAPLAGATVWELDAPGAATAIASEGTTIELIDIDGGKLVWRASCEAPTVAASAAGVVCGDDRGITVHDLSDGHAKWHHAGKFLAASGARVVVAEGDGATVLDVVKGAEVLHVPLPAGATVLAACDGEVLAALADGKLARIVGPKAAWTVATAPGDAIVSVDACTTGPILATVAGARTTALVALARDTGKPLARIDDVRGYWADDTDHVAVSTSIGVTRWDRALATADVLELPPLGALLAARGERRLVRVTAATAAVIDRRGVRAYVALPEASAALGDERVLAGPALRAFQIPRPWARPAPRAFVAHPLTVAAELRDLPQAFTPVPGAPPAFDLAGKPMAIALAGPDVVIATEAGLAAYHPAAQQWRWHVAAAAITALAASPAQVVYATTSQLTTLGPDGAPRWTRTFAGIDGLELAGDIVLVRARDRTIVLDAATGAELGALATRTATALALAVPGSWHGDETAAMPVVIAVEQDRLVARLPRAWMLPSWSLEVAGVVASVAPAGEGVVVALEDGDAYRIDARTGAATALAGLGLRWDAAADVLAGSAPGGVIPPSPIVPPPAKPEVYKPTDLEAAPAIATPWPAQLVAAARPASWQLTLYEPAGGRRTRNDYALTGAVTAAARAPGAPLVYAAGDDILVIDPRRGDPLRRVTLPGHGPVFSTIVDGKPVVGTILTGPLRAVVF